MEFYEKNVGLCCLFLLFVNFPLMPFILWDINCDLDSRFQVLVHRILPQDINDLYAWVKG